MQYDIIIKIKILIFVPFDDKDDNIFCIAIALLYPQITAKIIVLSEVSSVGSGKISAMIKHVTTNTIFILISFIIIPI
jgi:hypothetical protein